MKDHEPLKIRNRQNIFSKVPYIDRDTIHNFSACNFGQSIFKFWTPPLPSSYDTKYTVFEVLHVVVVVYVDNI